MREREGKAEISLNYPIKPISAKRVPRGSCNALLVFKMKFHLQPDCAAGPSTLLDMREN
jgi:hypothetical protein